MLNKPKGYVTTLKDKHSEKIVLDLIDGIEERIFLLEDWMQILLDYYL